MIVTNVLSGLFNLLFVHLKLVTDRLPVIDVHRVPS